MLRNLRRTLNSCFPMQCNSTKIIPLSGRRPANSKCLPSLPPPLYGRLIELSGVLLKTNVRPPSSVLSTTIRSQRDTAPIEREDQAENAASTTIHAPNFDIHHSGLPATGTDIARTQGPRKRCTRACVDRLPFARCWTLIYNRVQWGQRSSTFNTSTRPQIHQPACTITTASDADTSAESTVRHAYHHTDAPPACA